MLAVYILSATGVREFLKLPLLAAHFKKYKEADKNKDTGLVSFLLQHYLQEEGDDADSKEDSQLPFKSAEIPTPAAFTSTPPPSFPELQPRPQFSFNTIFRTYHDTLPPAGFSARVWQPPRHC